jgi:hypothetical protein
MLRAAHVEAPPRLRRRRHRQRRPLSGRNLGGGHLGNRLPLGDADHQRHLGGFTTYSSFNYETLALAQRGQWGLAAAYVSATLLIAWVAGVAGILLAQWTASGA